MTVLLEGDVGKFDSLDDLVTVGLKGESVVEGDTEVSEFGDLEEGEWDRVGREVSGEDPRLCRSCATLGMVFGFLKNQAQP